MGTLSLPLTDAFRQLHTDLYLHLDAAESLVSKTAEWSHQNNAGREGTTRAHYSS